MIKSLICMLKGHLPINSPPPEELIYEVNKGLRPGEVASYDTEIKCSRCNIILRWRSGWSIGKHQAYRNVYRRN